MVGWIILRFLQPTAERLRVVRLERLPLGTRYREVVADATGVGMPVVEMLAGRGFDGSHCAGDGYERRFGSADGGVWHVPRRDLLGKLVVEFEEGRLF
jgi:hypothetical protein